MNLIDKAIFSVFPGWGLKRHQAREVYGAYEAAKPNRLHKKRGDDLSGEEVTGQSARPLRKIARDLEQNNDLARGVLSCLVNNVVGTGILTDPQIKNNDGSLATEVNEQLLTLFDEWSWQPEVTHELSWPGVQRLAARSWFRDGEIFTQKVSGEVRGLSHASLVPYSLEMIESDLCPDDSQITKKDYRYGVKINNWGQVISYLLYKNHPGNRYLYSANDTQTKEIEAKNLVHLKTTERVRQRRGVSIFASVMNRIDDISDYEQSERIAARIAAAQVMAITKTAEGFGAGMRNNLNTQPGSPRSFAVAPGMVWDNLLPGEKPEILSPERPSNQIEPFRNVNMKAIAAGTDTSFSNIARHYEGTYSSQRQELVESWRSYEILRGHFIACYYRPIYKGFVDMAILSGEIKLPNNVNSKSLYNADYVGIGMPWIDPDRESKANIRNMRYGVEARSQVIRKRGMHPRDVHDQIKRDKENDELDDLNYPLYSETTENEESDNAD